MRSRRANFADCGSARDPTEKSKYRYVFHFFWISLTFAGLSGVSALAATDEIGHHELSCPGKLRRN